MDLGDIFVPALMVFILCYGLVKKVDIVNVFCEGAAENLKIAVGLIPMLILLMTAVGMFTSSGAVEGDGNRIGQLLPCAVVVFVGRA